jgi:hypothetical protein
MNVAHMNEQRPIPKIQRPLPIPRADRRMRFIPIVRPPLPSSYEDTDQTISYSVQAFILPGSMYISILFGAAYGVLIGVLLSCIVSSLSFYSPDISAHQSLPQCEATGALLNYALSAVVGPPLLTIESYRNRLELWRVKIMGDAEKGEQVGWDGVFSFLIVLRWVLFTALHCKDTDRTTGSHPFHRIGSPTLSPHISGSIRSSSGRHVLSGLHLSPSSIPQSGPGWIP